MVTAFGSSSREVFYEIVCRNFAKLRDKNLYWSLFFDKVSGWKPAALLKKTPTQVLCRQLCEIYKNTFSTKK